MVQYSVNEPNTQTSSIRGRGLVCVCTDANRTGPGKRATVVQRLLQPPVCVFTGGSFLLHRRCTSCRLAMVSGDSKCELSGNSSEA
jgi:hypothetical protein